MYAYKSNSPQYLDYIAACKTREEIQADPNLCVLLENEYIKDNMELALRWKEAKYGDYQAKYNFLEYLMCNGPEVDADTILHYRQQALRDPVMVEISYTYLSDVETLIQIRKEKYKKQSDDCFNNPCFYMGRFSAAMGEEGDVKATMNLYNFIGDICKNLSSKDRKDDETSVQQTHGAVCDSTATTEAAAAAKKKATAAAAAAKKVTAAATGAVPRGTHDQVQPSRLGANGTNSLPDDAPGSPSLGAPANQTAHPTWLTKGFKMLVGAIWNNDKTIFQNLNSAAIYNGTIGSWKSKVIQDALSITSAANVKRQLGDCARLWEQVRTLRIFSEKNTFGPITPDQKIDGINVNGMYSKLYGKADPSAGDVWKRLWTWRSVADDIAASQRTSTPTTTASTPTTTTPTTTTPTVTPSKK